MRYWVYEIAGWLLAALGLYVFYQCYLMLDAGRFFEGGPMTLIGFIIFRGGLYLMKVGVAARVCTAPPPPAVPIRASTPAVVPVRSRPVQATAGQRGS